MKLLVVLASAILLCLGHVEGSKYKVFPEGNEFHYSYLAHAISGLPDNSPQQSGIALKGSVIVQSQPNALMVQIEKLSIATINEKLDTVDLESIPYQWEPLDQQQQHIRTPMKVNMQRGEVVDFETSSQESDEVRNIKRAILTALQVQIKKIPRSSAAPATLQPFSRSKFLSAASYNMYVNEQVRSDSDDFGMYDVMEDDVAGKCVSQYIVSSDPWAGNPNQDVMNATKIDTYDDCEDDDLPDWMISTHPPKNCSGCDAEDIDPLTTVKITDYDMRVENGILVIERIESVAETVFTPLTSDSDEIHTNHTQIFTLRSMKPISSPLPRPVNSETEEDLEYDYPGADGSEPSEQELQQRPLQFLPLDGKKYGQNVRKLVDEITQDIRNNPRIPMTDTPKKVSALVRAIVTLPRSDIAQIYNEMATQGKQESSNEEAQTKRRVVQDTLLMSGTLPALSFMMDQIAKGEIQGEEANQALQGIAVHVRRPTAPLIKQLQQLCESGMSNNQKQTKSTCWMTFASLVDQSCGDERSTLPVSPDLDTYCTDSQARKFVQALASQLKSATRKEERMLFVNALGLISRPEIVEVLRPYVTGERSVSEAVRVQAIYAMSRNMTEEAADLLRNIAFDSDEETVARVAAFATLAKTNPDKHNAEMVAALLSNEDDDQVSSFVYSTMEQYANSTHPCIADISAHCSHALNFAEDTDIGIQDSQTVIVDDYDEDTDTGAIMKLQYTANNDSLIPRSAYLSLKRTISGYTQRPLAIWASIEGVQSVLERMVGPKAVFSDLSLRDILRSSYDNEQPKNYHGQFSKLNIDPRDDEPLSIHIVVQTQTSAYRHFHIDAKTIANAVENAMANGDMSRLNSGIKINYQKITSFGKVLYQFPSSLGLPIVLAVKSPAIIDIKGRIAVHVSRNAVTVEADIKPTVSVAIMTAMGVAEPFHKKLATAGVMSQTFVTAPAQIAATVEPQEARMTLKVKPLAQMAGSSNAKLFSHIVKPYTFLGNYDSFERPSSHNLKPIMSKDKLDEYEFNMGKSSPSGIPMQLKVKSDLFWQDQGSWLEYLLEENSPLSHAMLWWATPDFKYREYELTADANAASATEITATIDLDVLPSRFQQLLQQGQHDLNDMLTFAMGWSKQPFQCEAMRHDSSSLPHYPDNSKDSATAHTSNNDDDDENDDENYDENDDENNNQEQQNKWRHQSRLTRSLNQYSQDSSSHGSSTVEKINQSADEADNALRLKVDVAVKGPVSRSLHSTTTLTRNKLRNTDKLDVKVDITNPPFTSSDKLQICASGNMNYPKLPCDIANSLNPDNVGPVKGQMSISYGPSCSISNSNGQLHVDAQFSKTKEQKKSDREGDEWYFQQCEEDYHAGRRISEACIEAATAVANLNRAVIDIQHNVVPGWLLNETYKLDNFLKYNFYTKMTNNPINVHNGVGHIKIVTTFDSEDPTVDIELYKPSENTFFQNIFQDDISEYLTPMNARQSIASLIANDLMNGDAPPTCKLMSNYIESFENVTYKVPITGCKQVLAKDCSPSNLFGVLVRKSENSNSKELEVQLLQHKIVAQSAGGAHSGKFEISVDGQQQSLQDKQKIIIKSNAPEAKGKVIAYAMVSGDALQIRAPYHLMAVKFDGQNVKVELSNAWRGEVCGMCGEMTGDSDDPFVGPDQCSYANEKDFAYAYTVPSSQCSAPKPSNKKICPDDDDNNNNQDNSNNEDDNNDDDDDEVSGSRSSHQSGSMRARYGSSQSSSRRYYRNNNNNNNDDDEDDDNDDDDNNGSNRRRQNKYNNNNDDDDDEDDDDDDNDGGNRRRQNNNNDDNNDDDDDNRRRRNNNRNNNDDDDEDDDDDDDDDIPANANERTVIKYRPGKICFSITAVAECKPDCSPSNTQQRPLAFRCFSEASRMAQSMKASRSQRPLREVKSSGSGVDFTDLVQVPTSCRKN